MIHHPIKILLVEDHPGDVLLLQETLADPTLVKLEWVHIERIKTALDRLESEEFDVILLDLGLPDSNGLDTLLQLQAQVPLTPIVVLTGMTDENLALQAMQAGAQDYLVKGQGSGSDLLLRSIRYASERKPIEATLQQREREFRTLAENAPNIIARFDRQFRYLDVNSAGGAAVGLAVETFLGKIPCELGLPDVPIDRWQEVFQQVFATGKCAAIEFEVPMPSGVKYYQTRCVPELAMDGSIESVLAMTRDISELKLAEHKIREQAAPIDISPDAIAVCDRDDRVLFWNPGAAQIYGWTATEILGREARSLICREDPQQLEIVRQQLIATGEWQGESEISELPSGRGELMPIVDDETNIREMLKITLESYNYRTISASNGVEAIAADAIDRDRIQVVVLDIMMPLMDGTTVIRGLQQLNVDRQVKIMGLLQDTCKNLQDSPLSFTQTSFHS
jgi:PAS domain S-box-containing protein